MYGGSGIRARRLAAEKKTLACPKCRSKILIDEDTNVDIICNVCGSRFTEVE